MLFYTPIACDILGTCGNYGIVQVGSTVHLWRRAATWSCSFCPFQGRSSRVAQPSTARRHSLAPIRWRRQALCHSGYRLYKSDTLIDWYKCEIIKGEIKVVPAFSSGGTSALLRLRVNCPRRDSRLSSG